MSEFVMATNLPSETKEFAQRIDDAMEKAFALSHGQNLQANALPSETFNMDPSFTPDRATLRAKHGGAAIRPLKQREHFMNCVSKVMPQLTDRVDPTGEPIQGLFPSLRNYLGENWIRAGGQIATEYLDEYNRGKRIHEDLFNLVRHLLPEDFISIYRHTPEEFQDISLLQSKIQDERHTLRSLDLTRRASNLPVDDPRRMAFFANGKDPFASQLFSRLPDKNIQFSANEWTTAVACHMGAPIPILRPHIGKPIRHNPGRRNDRLAVDQHGFNLSKVLGIEGGGTQRNHNVICSAISNALEEAKIHHLGGDRDRSCKNIFRDAWLNTNIDAENEEDAKNMIVDIAILNKTAIGQYGFDYLVDVKTLAAGQCYQKRDIEFNFAVNQRQRKVNSDYHARAKRLDRSLHGTGNDQTGPFETILRQHGEDGRVLGPVTGFFGEASTDLAMIRDMVVTPLAKNFCDLFKCSTAEASNLFKTKINRRWGHCIARSWSRLIIDRLRDFVTNLPDQNRRDRNLDARWNDDAEEAFNFFNRTAA